MMSLHFWNDYIFSIHKHISKHSPMYEEANGLLFPTLLVVSLLEGEIHQGSLNYCYYSIFHRQQCFRGLSLYTSKLESSREIVMDHWRGAISYSSLSPLTPIDIQGSRLEGYMGVQLKIEAIRLTVMSLLSPKTW